MSAESRTAEEERIEGTEERKGGGLRGNGRRLTEVVDAPLGVRLCVDRLVAERAEVAAAGVPACSLHQYFRNTPRRTVLDVHSCAAVYPKLGGAERDMKTDGRDVNMMHTFRPIEWTWSASAFMPEGNFVGSAMGALLVALRAGACQP